MEYSRTVTTEYGLVRGIVKDGCEEYLGIPFALPPVGDLAFKHPLPPESWEGVLDATKAPISPVQGTGRSTIELDGRDCLYLNVFVPEDIEPGAPVMVWFYGGSYANGGVGRMSEDSDELSYDMARFARETKTVCVNFNYRLNLEGFLNLHFLDKNFDQKVATLKRITQLVPHETPLVIKAEQPGRYILYPHSEPVPEINKFENRLIGSFIGQDEKFGTPINQIDLSNGSILTLGRNSNGTVGFFYYNSVAPIPPYRAYLTYNSVTPESDSKSYFTFYIDDTIDTEPDGIDAPVSGQPHPSAVYNLQGQKVLQGNKVTKYQSNDLPSLSGGAGGRLFDSLPKGIYIVGGKKIIVP